MRLLYVTEDVPTDDVVHGDGSSMISFEIIRALPRSVDLRLLSFQGRAAVPAEVSERCAQVVLLPRRAPRQAMALSMASRLSIGAWERRTAQAGKAVREMSALADVTVLHGPHLTGFAIMVHGPLVIQVVDPWSLRMQMEARLATGPARRAYRSLKAAGALSLERKLPRRARLLTVGREDARAWAALLRREVRAVPNGVNPPEPAPYAATSEAPRLEGPPVVCFVGSLNYGPNIDSAHRLVEDIAPLVWRALPEVRFVLAGRQPTESVANLARDRVSVMADVPSMADVFAMSRAACFPDRQGLGIRNSVTEALAAGVRVVATPAAAREQPSSPLLSVAATTQELAAGLVEVLSSRQEQQAPVPRLRSWSDAAKEYLNECIAATGVDATSR